MHRFDYRFLADSLPANLLEIAGIIYDLRGKGEIRKMNNLHLFEELQHTAMVDSIQSSNAIEGIVTTAERVKKLVNKQSEPFTQDEQEILGYRDVLDEIYNHYEDLEITGDLLKHFHMLMLRTTSPDAGKYKQQNNWIQERDEQGRISIRFVPVKASETPQAVEQMILAWHEGKKYISIDKKINEYRYNYYQALKACSDGWHENRNTYIPFITYLLQILYSCYKDLDSKFIENSARKISKSKLIENTLMQSFVPVSKEEIAARFPEISITTVERVLGKLVREGKIEKIGTFRNARYRKL